MSKYPLLLAGLWTGCSNTMTIKEVNTPPSVSITFPLDGDSYDEYDPIEFTARVGDNQDSPQDLMVLWSSDLDGELNDTPADSDGIVSFVTSNLSPGSNTVTISATDSIGQRSSTFVTLTINDIEDAPTIDIRSPQERDVGEEDVEFGFEVSVADPQDSAEELRLSFVSNVDGEFCTPSADSLGIASCNAILSGGSHQLVFEVTDTHGYSTITETEFEVLPWNFVDNDGDDFSEEDGDCDDDNPSIYPGSEEVYNQTDDDCDGDIDENTVGWDDDGDGFSELGDDCDDQDPSIFPGAVETCDGIDQDCDGIIDNNTPCYDDDGDGYTELEGDCEDAISYAYPGGTEIADGYDNDCDGDIDEGTDYFDDDGDCWCEDTPCYGSVNANCSTLDFGDCDDNDDEFHPSASELCDNIDNNCNGIADENAVDATNWYADVDGDGHGNPSTVFTDCSAPLGYIADNTDCNDAEPLAWSGNSESCDGVDNNCDGNIDEGVTTTYYRDYDQDTYGDPNQPTTDCSLPPGYVLNSGDCNDQQPAAWTGRTETCDGIDNDCDSTIDEGVTTTYYEDYDGDSYGNPLSVADECTQPAGFVTNSQDCNDLEAEAWTGRTEECDSVDNDCDGTIDEENAVGSSEYFYDGDQDGYGSSVRRNYCGPTGYYSSTNDLDCNDNDPSAYPTATEICDNVDNNCDGITDEINAQGCTDYFRDIDGDGYGDASVSQCQCSPSGVFSSINNTDCYDSTNYGYFTHPGQTNYFSTDRGDGSFDYNCDSSESKEHTDLAECDVWDECVSSVGWYDSGIPDCGDVEQWSLSCIEECTLEVFGNCLNEICVFTVTNRVQGCR